MKIPEDGKEMSKLGFIALSPEKLSVESGRVIPHISYLFGHRRGVMDKLFVSIKSEQIM